MQINQVKLLTTLAKEIKAREKSKSDIIETLHSAKIITRGENFTEHFSNLAKVVAVSK